LKVLRSRLLQQKQEAYDQEYNAKRQSQVGSGDRSEKIRTYNFPQSRITDHRVNFTTHQLTSVLNGDIAELLDAVITHYQAEKLKEATEKPDAAEPDAGKK
jgi:peptide chain release factor 1